MDGYHMLNVDLLVIAKGVCKQIMFSLIIYGDGSQWDKSQPWSIDATRFLEFSCTEAEELFGKSRNLDQLDLIPTFVTGEWAGEHKIIRFGHVSRVRRIGTEIQFAFEETAHATTELFDDFSDELQLHQWEYSRSHWAIKSGEPPPELIAALSRGTFKEFPYEIVISYASEDIEYVNQVAKLLDAKGVRMFYAPFEEPELWGKSLSKRLDAIYRNLGRHCLMFVSKEYARKVWPNFERRIAMERSIQQAAEEREDYILACRFDDTEIPGMAEDVVYQDLTVKTPNQISDLVINKLRRKKSLLRK